MSEKTRSMLASSCRMLPLAVSVNRSKRSSVPPSASTTYEPSRDVSTARRLQNCTCPVVPPSTGFLPSGHAAVPPASVLAAAIASNAEQNALHPSKLIWFPSSHISPSSSTPLPHSGSPRGGDPVGAS